MGAGAERFGLSESSRAQISFSFCYYYMQKLPCVSRAPIAFFSARAAIVRAGIVVYAKALALRLSTIAHFRLPAAIFGKESGVPHFWKRSANSK